jgi:hypothetical protein
MRWKDLWTMAYRSARPRKKGRSVEMVRWYPNRVVARIGERNGRVSCNWMSGPRYLHFERA